jgi:hypothetical protein
VWWDRLVTIDLRGPGRSACRAHQRLAGDFDVVADALDIIVTHIGDQLSEQARRSVGTKLQQRDEVTGRRRRPKLEPYLSVGTSDDVERHHRSPAGRPKDGQRS